MDFFDLSERDQLFYSTDAAIHELSRWLHPTSEDLSDLAQESCWRRLDILRPTFFTSAAHLNHLVRCWLKVSPSYVGLYTVERWRRQWSGTQFEWQDAWEINEWQLSTLARLLPNHTRFENWQLAQFWRNSGIQPSGEDWLGWDKVYHTYVIQPLENWLKELPLPLENSKHEKRYTAPWPVKHIARPRSTIEALQNYSHM